MNAQEALAYIEPRLKEWCDYRESHSDVWHDNKNAQDYEALIALKQLLDQSNAKPKTLEQLGWEYGLIVDEQIVYTKKLFTSISTTIRFNKPLSFVTVFCELGEEKLSPILFHEELLAIAEKMKELGMTGEQIAKGETK